jgi:hypothetical protein
MDAEKLRQSTDQRATRHADKGTCHEGFGRIAGLSAGIDCVNLRALVRGVWVRSPEDIFADNVGSMAPDH